MFRQCLFGGLLCIAVVFFRLNVGQQTCDNAEKRQEGAQLEDEFNACTVGESSEKHGRYASETEIETEKESCNHTHFARFQFGGIDENG